MKPLSSHKSKPNKKPSCPFKRLGFFAECPQRLSDRIYAEIKEGVYEGVTPYDLFGAVRLNG
jgi:hypothetical protein